jgi:hypothetical protein
MRCRSAHALSVQERSRVPMWRMGRFIPRQTEAPLLFGPGPRQRASQRRDGEIRRAQRYIAAMKELRDRRKVLTR